MATAGHAPRCNCWCSALGVALRFGLVAGRRNSIEKTVAGETPIAINARLILITVVLHAYYIVIILKEVSVMIPILHWGGGGTAAEAERENGLPKVT